MKRIWKHVANSFKEAKEFDQKYYRTMSKEKRLDTMQFLRQTYYKLRGSRNEDGKRLRRVIKIIQ